MIHLPFGSHLAVNGGERPILGVSDHEHLWRGRGGDFDFEIAAGVGVG